jgi:hypothetical protein
MPNEIIRVDGTREEYQPSNGRHYSLEEMQKAIGGGYIQIVQTKNGRLMVLDEEGKLKGFPVNTVATALYLYGDQDPIVGDVLVCEDKNID